MFDATPAHPHPRTSGDPDSPIRVLMITSEYPSPERPAAVPFIVRQEKFLRSKGIDVEVFAFSGRKRFLNYAKAWRELRRFTAGKRYDLVHAQWGHSAALALPKRLPWVITFRGNDLEGIVGSDGRYTLKGRVLTAVARRMAAKADERIVVSESLGRRLGQLPFTVIPSGLDLERFRPLSQPECREQLALPAAKRLVLFAASTIENQRKRHGLAKAAVDLLKDKHDVGLVVANKVDHTLIPVYMSACDALLLTSMHEGSPNVVKEALACNLPVVSVDVGDVRQRIESIEGCELCTDDSPNAIADALDRVLGRPDRIDGRFHVAELDENNITERVIGVYRRALSKYARGSGGLNTEVIQQVS